MWLANLRNRRVLELPLLALLAVVLPVLAVAGCGGSSAGSQSKASAATSSTTGSTSAPAAGTSSSTQTSKIFVRPDPDDHTTEDFGHAASSAQKRALTKAVKAYYVAALAEEGATGCSMLVRSLEKAVPLDYGQPPGPPSLRGKTCPEVMSKVFKQNHQQLASEVPSMTFIRVRVGGNRGLVFMTFKTPEPRDIGAQLEGGTWKVGGLLDDPLP